MILVGMLHLVQSGIAHADANFYYIRRILLGILQYAGVLRYSLNFARESLSSGKVDIGVMSWLPRCLQQIDSTHSLSRPSLKRRTVPNIIPQHHSTISFHHTIDSCSVIPECASMWTVQFQNIDRTTF